ncbi:hypothetical protein [Diaphorobacter aerolatus]|uniref:Uncharacterized protein n=1 Tax=Diaphorobacter aerolatus TaxID=1288495 RepID=A0A7H0GQX0_9BURK|nr:hypothetical protein [Diaphorobacter aerolatus]QNP50686.1 hypothetical protein H9K75_22795 [Diaphorobacter aerolatus]
MSVYAATRVERGKADLSTFMHRLSHIRQRAGQGDRLADAQRLLRLNLSQQRRHRQGRGPSGQRLEQRSASAQGHVGQQWHGVSFNVVSLWTRLSSAPNVLGQAYCVNMLMKKIVENTYHSA